MSHEIAVYKIHTATILWTHYDFVNHQPLIFNTNFESAASSNYSVARSTVAAVVNLYFV